ncbi:MAG: ABC transporter substrate-binding protein [Actinomycetes bacterium]
MPSYNTAASPDLPPTFVEGNVQERSGGAPQLSTMTNSGADGKLVLGALLPTTGSLSTFAPAIDAAMSLAVDQINKAGGVLGRKVTVVSGDGGADAAQASVDQQLASGADAIVSATSSQTSLDLLDQVASAGVLMMGSSQTSPELTAADDAGLYYRTAPSDQLQGQVLADRVSDGGGDKVAIIARDDAYGHGLADSVTQRVKSNGGEVVDTTFYDVGEHRFGKEVQAVSASAPNAIVVVGFDESGKIIKELVAAGVGPNS